MFVRTKDKEARHGSAFAGEMIAQSPKRPSAYDPYVEDTNLANLTTFWVRVSPKILDTWKVKD